MTFEMGNQKTFASSGYQTRNRIVQRSRPNLLWISQYRILFDIALHNFDVAWNGHHRYVESLFVLGPLLIPQALM